MKRLLLFIAAVFSALSLFCQTKLTYENHALKVGDEHHFIIAKNVSAGSAGANQIWDYSALEYEKELFSHMESAENPIGAGDMYIEEFNNKFYFDVKPTRIEQYGTESCGNTRLTYSTPFIKMVFPFEYGNLKEGEFSGVSTSNGKEYAFSGFYKLEADAYGTLILPDGVVINNVIRLKTSRTSMIGSCGSSTLVTYRWYTDNVRYPLLTIIQNETKEEIQVIRTAYYADYKNIKTKEPIKGLEEQEGSIAMMRVSPNPCKDHIDIHLKVKDVASLELTLFSNQGQRIISKKIGTYNNGNFTYKLDTEELMSGTYIVTVTDGKNLFKETFIKID